MATATTLRTSLIVLSEAVANRQQNTTFLHPANALALSLEEDSTLFEDAKFKQSAEVTLRGCPKQALLRVASRFAEWGFDLTEDQRVARAIQKAMLLIDDPQFATEEDIEQLTDAAKMAQRKGEAISDMWTALEAIRKEGATQQVRDKADLALGVCSEYYELGLKGLESAPFDLGSLWRELEQALRVRDHEKLAERIFLIVSEAKKRGEKDELTKLISHPSPLVRSYTFNVFIIRFGMEEDVKKIWRMEKPNILRDLNNQDEDTQADAIAELGDFAQWGVSEARQMLFDLSHHPTDATIRDIAKFSLSRLD